MKKLAFLIYFLLLPGIPVHLYAGPAKTISLQSSHETKLAIYNKTTNGFSAVVSINNIEFSDYQSPEGTFIKLEAEGYSKNFSIEGQPHLPVITKLIEIPDGASAKVVISGYDIETISIDDVYGGLKIGPMQPSVSKSISSEMVDFVYDEDSYSINEYITPEPVTYEIVGKTRGFCFGKLKVSPFKYNPVENSLQILNNLSFEILYQNNTASLKKEAKKVKYSTAFKRALAPVEKLSDNISAKKGVLTEGISGPLTYVIVVHESFKGNSSLNEFINWKRQLGFVVIDAYTDDPSVGTTNESIKRYLERLYRSKNSPTYALLIGDVDKIPTWNGRTDVLPPYTQPHSTDLYYFTYGDDSDYLPDMYYGRFPADNVYDLEAIISKTLQYEKFEFAQETSSGYLDNYMFIAGDDDLGSAASHGNAQVNYAVSEYFPTIFKYLYTGDSSGLASKIKYNFDQGMGFVNYTGHCDTIGWYNQELGNYYFATIDLLNMKNRNKYGFVIGNCCESSKFDNDSSQDEPDSFGEMILKKSNGGAIGYIGAANDTFWDEDFYWSVGKSSLSLTDENAENHTFDNTQTGIYDGLFFINDENELYATAGEIVYRGNLAVTESDSRWKQYYWEVYNLMGDPALKPYLSSEPDGKSIPEGPPQISTGSDSSGSSCFIGVAWDSL